MKHVVLVIVISIVGASCLVGQDNKNGALFSGGTCEGAGSNYGECVEDVGKDRDACYAGCFKDAGNCALEAAIGFAAGNIDCVGPVLAQVIGCELCNGKTGNEYLACQVQCAVSSFDTYIRDPNFFDDLAKCFADGPAVDAFAKNFKIGLAGALASGAGCALGYFVCTSQDNVGPFQLGSCDTLFTAGIDACETAQCNPAFCTCFDAQECPTIAGGAASTHMTGVVACDSISVGKGTTAQGTEVSCISFTNNAEPETCTETGWNPDGSFGNRGRFEACDSDAHCGSEGDMALSCMDYDCDGRRHCDFSDLGGTGNCCEINGPLDAGCQDGFSCEYNEDRDRMMCVKEEEPSPGPGSGG